MKIHKSAKVRECYNRTLEIACEYAEGGVASFVSGLPEMTPIEQVVFFDLLDYCHGNNPTWKIFPQYSINKYRVDFLVASKDKDGKSMCVVVECDGHDFHEKTKEQVARDKKRDRYLQKIGYHVLRYSGSEIWNDKCCVSSDLLDYFRERYGCEDKSKFEKVEPCV